ncbi:MAG TPA: hypothetical protein VHE83_00020 [Mycobacteriales bacterium]|nr:hypothetical protein [Mycobacteriales bacterium]
MRRRLHNFAGLDTPAESAPEQPASRDELSAPRRLDLDALLIPFQRSAPAAEALPVHPSVSWTPSATAPNR